MPSTDDTRTKILKAAGVNISLVSYHFGGKDALYRECIKQTGTNRLTIAREIFTPATSVQDMRAKIIGQAFLNLPIPNRQQTTLFNLGPQS